MIKTTAPEVRLFLEAIKQLDSDKTGTVSRDELCLNLEKIKQSHAVKLLLARVVENRIHTANPDGRLTRAELKAYLETLSGQINENDLSDLSRFLELDKGEPNDVIDVFSNLSFSDFYYSQKGQAFLECFIAPAASLALDRTSLFSAPCEDDNTPCFLDKADITGAARAGQLLDYALMVEDPEADYAQELTELEMGFYAFASEARAEMQDSLLGDRGFTTLKKQDPQAFADVVGIKLVQQFLERQGVRFVRGIPLHAVFADQPRIDCNTYCVLALHLLKLIGIESTHFRMLPFSGTVGHVVLVRPAKGGDLCFGLTTTGKMMLQPCQAYLSKVPLQQQAYEATLVPAEYVVATIQTDKAQSLARKAAGLQEAVHRNHDVMAFTEQQVTKLAGEKEKYERQAAVFHETVVLPDAQEPRAFPKGVYKRDFRHFKQLGLVATDISVRREWLEKAYQLYSGDHEVNESLSAVYVQLGDVARDTEKALRLYELAWQIWPYNENLPPAIAVCYEQCAVAKDVALKDCQGELFRLQQETQQAQAEIEQSWNTRIALYRNALEILPHDAILHYNLGTVLLQNEKTQALVAEAKQHFETALRLNPGFIDPIHQLGIVLAEEGQFDEAIGLYQRYLEAYEATSPQVLDGSTAYDTPQAYRDRSDAYYNMCLIAVQKCWALEQKGAKSTENYLQTQEQARTFYAKARSMQTEQSEANAFATLKRHLESL